MHRRYAPSVGRFLFTFSVGLSSLLFIIAVATWVGSYWSVWGADFTYSRWVTDHHRRSMSVDVELNAGYLLLEVWTHDVDFDPSADTRLFRNAVPGQTHLRFRSGAHPDTWSLPYEPESTHFFGFSYYRRLINGRWSPVLPPTPRWQTDVTVPIWATVMLTAVLPIAYFISAYRRNPKRQPGHCRACGYNLSNNQSGICPECGRAIRTRSGKKKVNDEPQSPH